MSKNNKRNRARRKRARDRKRRRHTPGVNYRDEDDIAVKCPSCQTTSLVPVSAMRITQDTLGAQFGDVHDLEVSEAAMTCVTCGHQIPYEPRVKRLPDGSAEIWTDRSVVDEYTGEEVYTSVLEERDSGRRVSLTQGDPEFEFWATCDECRKPFRAKGSLAYTMEARHEIAIDLEIFWHRRLTVDWCHGCPGDQGVGHAILTRTVHDNLVTYANSPGFADLIGMNLAEQVATGELDLATAARTLRRSGNKQAARLADFIESRPVTAMLAATLITSLTGLVGANLGGRDTEEPGPPTAPSYNEEQVDHIIDSILDHYDEKLEHRPHKRPPSDHGSGKPNQIRQGRAHARHNLLASDCKGWFHDKVPTSGDLV